MSKRGRKKTNKEYAIRLVHPEFGEYYFNYVKYSDSNYGYSNIHNFMFTKDLSKVKKWKILDVVNYNISNMTDKVQKISKDNILLQIDDNAVKSDKMIISRKKYYYQISQIGSESIVCKIKEKIEKCNEILLSLKESIKKEKDYYNNLNLIKNEIKNEIDIENISKYHSDILSRLNSIKKNIKKCKSYQTDIDDLNKKLSEIETGIKIDIVDASFNFRLKKLKTLKIIEEKEEEIN